MIFFYSRPQFRHVFQTVRDHGDRPDAVHLVVDPTRHVVLRARRLQSGASGASAVRDRHPTETRKVSAAQGLLLRTVHFAVLPTKGDGRPSRHRVGRGNDGVQHRRLLALLKSANNLAVFFPPV